MLDPHAPSQLFPSPGVLRFGWQAQGRRTAVHSRPSKDEKEPKTTKQRLLKVAKWGGIAFLVLSLIAVGGFIVLYRSIDIPDPNEDFQTEASHIYYADGKTELGKFATQNRDSVGLDEMPQNLKDAVVAAENQTFWTDKGIDPKGILRAAFSNASGNSTQGASTITQQYVKILYLTQEQSYKRKVKEAILSLKIQRQQSKEEILEGYLNTIYFGRGAYGVEAAAQAYFDDLRQGPQPARVRGAGQRAEQPHQLRPRQRAGQQGGAQGALRLRARQHGRPRQHHRGGGGEGPEAAAEVPEDHG